jgi:hypothetical protein
MCSIIVGGGSEFWPKIARYEVNTLYPGVWGSEREAVAQRIEQCLPYIRELDEDVARAIGQTPVLPFGARFFVIQPDRRHLYSLPLESPGDELHELLEAAMGVMLPPLPVEPGLYDRVRKTDTGFIWWGANGCYLRGSAILASMWAGRSVVRLGHLLAHEGKHVLLDHGGFVAPELRRAIEQEVLAFELRLNDRLRQAIASGELPQSLLAEVEGVRKIIESGR